MSEIRLRSLRALPVLLLALALLAGLLGAWPQPEASLPRTQAVVAEFAPLVGARPGLPVAPPEEAGVFDARLPSRPPAPGEALADRLRTLGADEAALVELVAALEAERTGAELSEHERTGLVDELALPFQHEAKALELLTAFRQGRTTWLHGLNLPLADRLFIGELASQGLDVEAAAWLALSARESGWPEGLFERERLRPLAEMATEDPHLQEWILDAAVLRTSAEGLLDLERQRELLAPTDGAGELPTPDAVICRDCPYWNFGLLYPTTAWQTHQSDLQANECKVYRFVVQAGSSYQFSTCLGGGSASFDSTLSAKGSTCTPLGFSDDDCGTASDLTVLATATGYLYVQVAANSGESGPYTLAFREIEGGGGAGACTSCPDYDAAPGLPLPVWRTVDGTIGADGCMKFRFEARLNRTYRFTTCEAGSGGTANFDTVIETETNSQSCFPGPGNGDSCGNLGSTVDLTSRFSQFITVTVRGFAGAGGDFTLAYKDVTGECPTCPNFTQILDEPTAEFSYYNGQVDPDACDLLRVTLRRGQSYRFTFCEGDGTQQAQFPAELTLLDADCQPLSPDTTTSCARGPGLDYTSCRTQYAYLRVANTGPDSGAYRIMMTELCGYQTGCAGGPACNTQIGPLTVPPTGWGTVTAQLPSDGCRVLSFQLEAKRSYRFTFCEGGGSIPPGGSVTMRLRRPDCDSCPGAVVTSPPCTGGRGLEFTPLEDGLYHLVLEEGDGDAYPVTLAYREECTDCPAATVVPAAPTCAWQLYPPASPFLLTPDLGCRLFRFSTVPGQVYRFTLCETSSEGQATGAVAPAGQWSVVIMEPDGTPCRPVSDEIACARPSGCPNEAAVVASGTSVLVKVSRACGGIGAYRLAYREGYGVPGDTDGDGTPNCTDPDDDNDGVPDQEDPEPENPQVCGDSEPDGCDDCVNNSPPPAMGAWPPQSPRPDDDGPDNDEDGLCDAGDPDDDDDGVEDGADLAPFDPNQCRDVDGDGCDDCSETGADGSGGDPGNDGPDSDADGVCDDGDVEECDGVDNDGDGDVDEGLLTTYYPDADGDGFGSDVPEDAVEACERPPGHRTNNADCDDTDPEINPNATEIPNNGIDEDCDGTDGSLCYPDADEDGFGDADAPGTEGAGGCPQGFVPDASDCDDGDGSVNPEAAEVCNGRDDDCDGVVPTTEIDDDEDGFAECEGDCDDGDASRYPGNAEVCDGRDNDCNGVVPATEIDDDEDGFAECAGDCDDGDASRYPGNAEVCDGKDNDCDGVVPPTEIDDDEDGFAECEGDCDDGDASRFPGNAEVCDGEDNDCDGVVPPTEIDDDEDGFAECEGDCDDGDASRYPGNAEVCDGKDNDCDGVVPPTEIDDDEDGFAECQGDCDDGDATRYPGNAEVCDGKDNDCDGVVPPTEIDDDEDGFAECAGDCDDGDASRYPGNAEVCDGKDNDCDGVVPPAEIDDDEDGFAECAGDCDDGDASRYPGNAEVCDGKDNDCDGVVPPAEIDDDEDGFAECEGDCDDGDATRYPGNAEVCDGEDNDCDGVVPPAEIDDDEDGFAECEGDCDDGDASRYPGNAEVCDGKDNDCDGVVPPDEIDGDDDGWAGCEGDCDDADPNRFPTNPELCTGGVDEDCDGLVDCDDDDCAGSPSCGPVEDCDVVGDEDMNGPADCADAACAGQTGPAGQVCEPSGETRCMDGLDNDGDGLADGADTNCACRPCSTDTGAWVWCNNTPAPYTCRRTSGGPSAARCTTCP